MSASQLKASLVGNSSALMASSTNQTVTTQAMATTNTNNNLCIDPLRDKGIFEALENDNSTSFQGYDA